jgi:hypothetical protein
LALNVPKGFGGDAHVDQDKRSFRGPLVVIAVELRAIGPIPAINAEGIRDPLARWRDRWDN